MKRTFKSLKKIIDRLRLRLRLLTVATVCKWHDSVTPPINMRSALLFWIYYKTGRLDAYHISGGICPACAAKVRQSAALPQRAGRFERGTFFDRLMRKFFKGGESNANAS